MLRFTVNGQTLARVDSFHPATDSEGYLQARFTFSSDWAGTAKVALFRDDITGETYRVTLSINDVCDVPAEVLAAAASARRSYFMVTVYGVSADTPRVTTNELRVDLKRSGFGSAVNPGAPTPSEYEQILAGYAEAQSAAATVSRQTYYIGANLPQQLRIRNMVAGSYYSNATGEILNADTYKRSEDLIPCQPGVLLSCRQKVADDTMMVVCYDRDLALLDYRMIISPDSPLAHNRFALIPEGTAYIGFNVMTANNTTEFVLDVIDGSKVQTVSYPFPDNNKEYLAFSGYWVNGLGNMAAASNMSCVLVPNITGEKLFIDVQYAYNAIFFDANNAIISNGSERTVAGVKGALYDIPKNAAMVAINLSGTQTDMDGTRSSFAAFVRTGGNRIAGKKILAIGDSITWLDGRAGDYDGSTAMLGWQTQLRKMGAMVDTLAYSGACYADNAELASIHQQIVDGSANVSGYDMVVLFGGSNDVRLSSTMGAASESYDIPNIDPATFNGALGGIIQYIREKNPAAEVYLCTTLPSESDARPYAKTKQYRDAIIQNGDFWGVPVIDLFTAMNVTPGVNFSNFFYDNTHPNTHGMERIGRIIGEYILAH